MESLGAHFTQNNITPKVNNTILFIVTSTVLTGQNGKLHVSLSSQKTLEHTQMEFEPIPF